MKEFSPKDLNVLWKTRVLLQGRNPWRIEDESALLSEIAFDMPRRCISAHRAAENALKDKRV